MTNVIAGVGGLQDLIDGGGTFANMAAFYGSVENLDNLAPSIPLSNLIGLANLVYQSLPGGDPPPRKNIASERAPTVSLSAGALRDEWGQAVSQPTPHVYSSACRRSWPAPRRQPARGAVRAS